MDQVGIRELRQNLSVHLRRVKRGESLEVTEHGHPVAVLVPLPDPVSTRGWLLASGKCKLDARRHWSAPSSLASSASVSEALAEERGERL